MHKLEAMRRLYTGGLRKQLTPRAFWLLGYYALRMNDLCEAWPSASSAARDGGMDLKHIQRSRKQLVGLGYLTRLNMQKAGAAWVQKFRVVLPEVTIEPPADCAPPPNAPPRQIDTQTPADLAPNPPPNAPPDPPPNAPPKSYIESINESDRESITPARSEDPSPFEKMWQEYPSGFKDDETLEQCRTLWRQQGCDARAPAIMEHLAQCNRSRKWLTGYAPSPVKYLKAKQYEHPAPPPPPKTPAEKRQEEFDRSMAKSRPLPDATPLSEGAKVDEMLDHELGYERGTHAKARASFNGKPFTAAEWKTRLAEISGRSVNIDGAAKPNGSPLAITSPPAPETPEQAAERVRKDARDKALNNMLHRGRQNLLSALKQKDPRWKSHDDVYRDEALRDAMYALHLSDRNQHRTADV